MPGHQPTADLAARLDVPERGLRADRVDLDAELVTGHDGPKRSFTLSMLQSTASLPLRPSLRSSITRELGHRLELQHSRPHLSRSATESAHRALSVLPDERYIG